MDTLVSSYLTKKFSTPKSASLSNNIGNVTRVQGLLSNDITFVRSGPQNDPWLKSLDTMKTPNGVKQNAQTESSVASTSKTGNGQKAVKRPNSDQNANHSHQVVIRNSGGRGQVGLTNIGNTCYFNAMLQCLTNCKPFYNYISSNAHDRAVCKRGENCVLCLLKNFCLTYLSTNPTKKVVTHIVLRELLDKMKTVVRRWRIHAQQSADEILSYIMNAMWERDMNYFGVKGPQTPMFNIFGTVIEQQYACSLCGQASISKMVEPTIILGLVNGDKRSVQDRLRVEYGLAETLSEPKDKCDGCGKSRTPRPTMKRVLKNLPMVLVVMLKRFYVIDGVSHKINQFVQFPEMLDLRPCMDTSTQGQISQYRLTGVVEHWGKSVTDGHYVAYCKNFCPIRQSEVWFYLDDSTVRPIDLKSVLQKNAYLIFYTIQGQSSRTVKIPMKVKDSNGANSEAKIRKLTPNGNTTPKNVLKNGNGVGKPTTNGKPSKPVAVTPPVKFSDEHNKKGDAVATQRKSLFSNGVKLVQVKKPAATNGSKVQPAKGLVPYESSEDEANEPPKQQLSDEPLRTVPTMKPRASSSAAWVVDKQNDAPSVTSNSSQNSSVQGTSPGWKVSENGQTKLNGKVNEKVTTLSYAPQMPPGFRQKQPQKPVEVEEEPQTESEPKETAPFSYWGASADKVKDEREAYDEEIDSGRHKKKKNKATNQYWKGGENRPNPFQCEQNYRFKTMGIHSNRIQKPLRHQEGKFSRKGQPFRNYRESGQTQGYFNGKKHHHNHHNRHGGGNKHWKFNGQFSNTKRQSNR